MGKVIKSVAIDCILVLERSYQAIVLICDWRYTHNFEIDVYRDWQAPAHRTVWYSICCQMLRAKSARSGNNNLMKLHYVSVCFCVSEIIVLVIVCLCIICMYLLKKKYIESPHTWWSYQCFFWWDLFGRCRKPKLKLPGNYGTIIIFIIKSILLLIR